MISSAKNQNFQKIIISKYELKIKVKLSFSITRFLYHFRVSISDQSFLYQNITLGYLKIGRESSFHRSIFEDAYHGEEAYR